MEREESTNNKSSWIWVVLGILFVMGFITFFLWATVREYKFENNHRFTIATTIGPAMGGWVDFEFVVNGVTYKRGDKGLSLKSKHGKYFVRYYAPDPSVLAKVVSNEEISDCIGEPPEDGWDELPSCK